jgi:glycosyl transferase family WbsX
VLHGTSFKLALYYEIGAGMPTAAKMRSDLDFAYSRYAQDSSYLRQSGKPVLFVYNSSSDGANCAAVSRLKTAASRFYLDLKVFTGFRKCGTQPDSWHQYGPAVRESHIAGFSYSISPGFYKATEHSPRLPRSVSAWTASAKRMVASRENWQLVTTFNEWGEGTAIEPAREWGNAYLDGLQTAIAAAPH